MKAWRPYVTTSNVLRLRFKPTSWIQNPGFIPLDMPLLLVQGRMWHILREVLQKGREEMASHLRARGRSRSGRPGRLMCNKDKGDEETAWEEEGGDKQSQYTLRDQCCRPVWAGRQRGAKSWSWRNASSRSPNATMATMVNHGRVLRQHTIVAAPWDGHQGNNI